MIIPNRNPWELLMAEQQVKIRAVSRQSLSVIVESEYLAIWERNAIDAVSPSVVAILIFVNVISQMNHVVDRVFTSRVAICIEEPKRVIAARVDCDLDLCVDLVALVGGGLRAPNWTDIVRIANVELVVWRRISQPIMYWAETATYSIWCRGPGSWLQP